MAKYDPHNWAACRQAFTLIEILIVLGIILVLASFATVGLGMLEEQRGRVISSQRIEHVLNSIARVGLMGSASVTYELQSRVSGGIGGTRRFERPMGASAVKPENDAPWHRVFPHPDAVAPDNPLVGETGSGSPLVMAYPWGHQRLYRIGGQGPQGTGDDYYWNSYESLVDGDPDYAYPAPERHIIRELWPRKSADILAVLGIAPDAATYYGNRNPKQPWNDAWGFPLIVSYALYQPPEYLGGIAGRFPDFYLQQARDLYQYNRSIFVSVAAAGPDIFPYALVADWQINQIALWNHICDVAMPSDEYIWDELSFTANPWSGIHQRSEGARRVFISAPVEFR